VSEQQRDSLMIDIRVGESVSIDGGRVVITLKEKSGQRAKLHFSAEEGVSVEPFRVLHAVKA
jgi:hypothetical protein